MTKIFDELDYLPSPSTVVADRLSFEPAVDPTERNVVIANYVVQPSMPLPPSNVLPSCLRYRSAAATHDADSQQTRRKIRFAEDIEQLRTLV